MVFDYFVFVVVSSGLLDHSDAKIILYSSAEKKSRQTVCCVFVRWFAK